jgi:uncharacterized membrane protein
VGDLLQALEDLAAPPEGARRSVLWLRVIGLLVVLLLSATGGVVAWGGRTQVLSVVGMAVLLLVILLAAYGLWRRGSRRRPVRSPPPLDLD